MGLLIRECIRVAPLLTTHWKTLFNIKRAWDTDALARALGAVDQGFQCRSVSQRNVLAAQLRSQPSQRDQVQRDRPGLRPWFPQAPFHHIQQRPRLLALAHALFGQPYERSRVPRAALRVPP